MGFRIQIWAYRALRLRGNSCCTDAMGFAPCTFGMRSKVPVNSLSYKIGEGGDSDVLLEKLRG